MPSFNPNTGLLVLAMLISTSTVCATPARAASTCTTGVCESRLINADQEPGQWLTHGRTYSEQRFSPLDQINQKTVSGLGLAWHHATGNRRGMEATPLVADGVMYTSTAWSRVIALEADTGKKLWRFDPEVPGEKGRNACCDVVNRGVALWQDKVYIGTIDGRLIALDARNGEPVWSVQTTDPDKPYTITGAPRVVKGLVIIGNGGAEFGVRGYFSAYDANTGEMKWRFYTVPASAYGEVEHKELEMARRTWSPDSLWETGLGGTVWDSFAYDPDLNLLYVGVGNSSPYNRAVRSPGGGDNLFLTSILAINPDTGRLKWHYQTTPAESWDYTATQHMILAELDILGERRKVLMQAPKNGFFYVLDRATGELLSADNYVPVNWASHVDLESGRPVETGIGDWSTEQRFVSPAVFGGHNWHPMAYSPATRLVYLPTIHAVYPFTPDPDFRYNPATFNTGENWSAISDNAPSVNIPLCSPTRLTAWDPVEKQQVWQVKFNGGVSAGVLATQGGLVFQGTTDGRLVAYADSSGEELWAQQVNVGIMAPPISYRMNGEQYIAVVAGIGGAQGIHMDNMENINSGHIFSFKLSGKALPPYVPAREETANATLELADNALDEAAIHRGSRLYNLHCLRCHGMRAASTGLIPDLRHSSAGIHELWQQIVIDGVLASNGMASFKDVLNESDVRDIHSYVISEAVESSSWSSRLLQSAADQICIPAEWLAE